MQEGLPRRYFWYPRARLLFCGVCKVGFKSLEEVFSGLPGGQMLVGLQQVVDLHKQPKVICQFVREPRERLVSMYEYFNGGEQAPMPGMTQQDIYEWYDETWQRWDLSFEQFVLGLPTVVDNHHFRSQSGEHGELADHRFRIDRAQKAWQVLRNVWAPGLPVKFPKVNTTEHKQGLVGEYFDALSGEAYAVYEKLYGPDEQFYRDAQPRV